MYSAQQNSSGNVIVANTTHALGDYTIKVCGNYSECMEFKNHAQALSNAASIARLHAQVPDMNTQNRTADGKFATKKEAQRCDCKEMIAWYLSDAKSALRTDRNAAAVKKWSDTRKQLSESFFADYNEPLYN